MAPPTPATPGYAKPSDYASRTDAGEELVKNADGTVVLDFQDSDWIDSNNDRRYSLYLQNPPGVDGQFTDIKVVNGDSLHVIYTEVPYMHSMEFPMEVDTVGRMKFNSLKGAMPLSKAGRFHRRIRGHRDRTKCVNSCRRSRSHFHVRISSVDLKFHILSGGNPVTRSKLDAVHYNVSSFF